jgi:cation-transporting ATPase 13A1
VAEHFLTVLIHSPGNPRNLTPVTSTDYHTTLTLASAHALVLLEEGTVGDPMEKATLDAMNWKLSKGTARTLDLSAGLTDFRYGIGDVLTANSKEAQHRAQITIRRRFQFSSALKRMSTVSHVVTPGGAKKQTFVSVKGAPETLRGMYVTVPDSYDSTYKWFAQMGSRVIALGYKTINVAPEAASCLSRLFFSRT